MVGIFDGSKFVAAAMAKCRCSAEAGAGCSVDSADNRRRSGDKNLFIKIPRHLSALARAKKTWIAPKRT
jgi:hypothetical protein